MAYFGNSLESLFPSPLDCQKVLIPFLLRTVLNFASPNCFEGRRISPIGPGTWFQFTHLSNYDSREENIFFPCFSYGQIWRWPSTCLLSPLGNQAYPLVGPFSSPCWATCSLRTPLWSVIRLLSFSREASRSCQIYKWIFSFVSFLLPFLEESQIQVVGCISATSN